MVFFKIDLVEVREHLGIVPKEYKGRRGEPSHVCLLCNREIKDPEKQKYVHLTTDGFLVPNDIEVDNSQGGFPVGSDCARKLNNLIKVAS